MSGQSAIASTLFRTSSQGFDFAARPPDTTVTRPREDIANPMSILAELIRPLRWDRESVGTSLDRERDNYGYWIATAARARVPLRPAWRPQIEAAATRVEIVAVLRLFGLDAIANRLGYLRSLADEDPDEKPMEIESMRWMALFLMGQRQLPDPQIGITPDGLAHIEWRFSSNGILAMQFLASGSIRFAAVSAPAETGGERLNVSGTLPKNEALAAVEPFARRL